MIFGKMMLEAGRRVLTKSKYLSVWDGNQAWVGVLNSKGRKLLFSVK